MSRRQAMLEKSCPYQRHGNGQPWPKAVRPLTGEDARRRTSSYVLFLVPSLALMSQTIREWTIDTETPLRAFAVCSDAHVGKRRRDWSDIAEVDLHDLDYSATTNAANHRHQHGGARDF